MTEQMYASGEPSIEASTDGAAGSVESLSAPGQLANDAARMALRMAGLPSDFPVAPIVEAIWKAAERAGYERAIAVLRDDARYSNWWTSLPQEDPMYGYWQSNVRQHLADYLTAIEHPAPRVPATNGPDHPVKDLTEASPEEVEAELQRVADEVGEDVRHVRDLHEAMQACGDEERIEREVEEQRHCYHHTHDYSDRDSSCAAGDCGDEDECIHCECCCSCLGCEYGPRESVLMTPEQMAPLAPVGSESPEAGR